MSKGFACDTDEMRALIARHEELRSDLERVIVPPKGAAWGFSVVRGAYKELAEDCADRREIMQEWCTRASGRHLGGRHQRRPPHLPLISPERRYAAPFP